MNINLWEGHDWEMYGSGMCLAFIQKLVLHTKKKKNSEKILQKNSKIKFGFQVIKSLESNDF